MPSISVIIPVYNAEKTLTRSVGSVLGQTFQDFELILVDNNSRDGSAGVCQGLAQGDARIRLCSETKQGASAARNCGLARATGDYVYFLDADDELTPDALEKLIAEARALDADLVAPGMTHVMLDKDGRESSRFTLPQQEERCVGQMAIARAFARHLPRYGFFGPNMLYRRALLAGHQLCFDEGVHLGEDVLFNIALMRRASCIAMLGEVVYHYYRFQDGSLNSRYHQDMVGIKLRIAHAIESFLTDAGCWDDTTKQSFYTMFVQDAFTCVANLFKDPQYDRKEAKKIFSQLLDEPMVRELIARRKSLVLPKGKQLFLGALAKHSFFLAHMAAVAFQLMQR